MYKSHWLASISVGAFASLIFVWDKELIDIWKHTSLSNGGFVHKLGELVITSDGQVQVLWGDGLLLSGLAHVSCELAKLFTDVLEDTGAVGTCTATASLTVPALSEKSCASSWGKNESSFSGSRNDSSSFLLSNCFW